MEIRSNVVRYTIWVMGRWVNVVLRAYSYVVLYDAFLGREMLFLYLVQHGAVQYPVALLTAYLEVYNLV